MLLKYQALPSQLQKTVQPLYVLIGNENYLLHDAALKIKKAWNARGNSESKTLHITNSADWAVLFEEATSYSLFSENVLLDVYFDKKTIDTTGKEVLTRYLENTNPRCLILLRASLVPAKQLLFLSSRANVTLIQLTPLTEINLRQWIAVQLQERFLGFTKEAPALIQQYTQGNMLATAQLIEKLTLIHDNKHALTLQDIQEQLIDQCDYPLYELNDACLNADTSKAIQLLRQFAAHKEEPTLLLWLLTQELRKLISLTKLLSEGHAFAAACQKLSIWSQRMSLYEKALRRLPKAQLYNLLRLGKDLDEQIKSNQSSRVWQSFEKMALCFCLGR